MSIWRKVGLGDDVYDLMVKMRGGSSRLSLLKHLDLPRHRMELSEITGIDWKETDRELKLLESHGLVYVYASSGSVKVYSLTAQGRLVLELMDGMTQKQ